MGSALPGAQGKTLADQDKIDETVARGCGGGAYRKAACKNHSQASEQRRAELRGAS